LLGVLPAEVSHVRPDDVDELEDHRGHPAEVTGAGGPAEHVLEALHLHKRAKPGGVHHGAVRGEHQVHPFPGANLQVRFPGPGVAAEILVRAELGRVHKNGDHHEPGLRARGADQAGVALVQGPHGGDQADGATPRSGLYDPLTDRFDGDGDFWLHDRIRQRK
jgi:hypothetical protein